MKIKGYKVILHTNKGQFEETVKGDSIEVGRNLSADLPIMASGVSRSHLKISFVDNEIILKDMGSTNGTYLRGERLDPHKDKAYTAGERISLGQAGCFIRVEVIEDKAAVDSNETVNKDKESDAKPAKEESAPVVYSKKPDPEEPEGPYMQDAAESSLAKKVTEDTGFFNIFGKSDPDAKEKKKAEKYMQQAEKLVKKRIKEAEDSIRKGIQKARSNAQDILLAAKKEADTLKSETEVSQNKILIEAKKEADKIKNEAYSELNKIKEDISKEKTEGKELIETLNSQIAQLKKDRIKYEDEAQETYQEKLQLEQERKEVDVKLNNLKDSHKSQVAALESEINFMNSEVENQELKLKELNSRYETNEISHKNKIESLELQYEEVNQRLKQERKEIEESKKSKEGLAEEKRGLSKEIQKNIKELEELRKKFEQVEYRKKHLSEEVEQIELRAKNEANSIIEEAQLKSSKMTIEARESYQKFVADKEKVKLEAETIKKETQEKRNQVLLDAENNAKDIISDAQKSAEQALSQAKEEKEEYLKKTKAKFEQAEHEYRQKMHELETEIKERRDLLEKELSSKKQAQRNQLERDLAQLKITQLKEIEEDVENQKLLLNEYKEDYANSWSLSISFAVESILKKEGVSLESVNTNELRDKFKSTARSIILDEDSSDEEIKSFMKFDPQQRLKVKKFWRRTATVSVALFIGVLLYPYIAGYIGSKKIQFEAEQKEDAKQRVAEVVQEQKDLRTFIPEKREEYLDSYTDRVLYTTNYVENELSKEYREDWFLSLDTFFVEELILSDEAIVTFISKETNLIKDLREARDSINAQVKEQGIQKMREVEARFITDIKKVIKTDGKYKMFQNFKKNYFLKHHPFTERELATEDDSSKKDE